MNDHLSDSYKTERDQFRLVKIFSVICIILSCLGLIGFLFVLYHALKAAFINPVEILKID